MDFQKYLSIDAISNSMLGDVERGGKIKASQSALDYGTTLDRLLTEPKGSVKKDAPFYEEANKKIKILDKHPYIKKFIEMAQKQVLLVEDIDFGFAVLKCKGLADLYTNISLGDIKTTSCKTENAFIKSIIKFGYHRQAAWYMMLSGIKMFYIIAFPKTVNSIWVYKINYGDEMHRAGVSSYMELTERWYNQSEKKSLY